MGWQGPTAGQGFNELGSAIGRGIIYKNFVRRVVNEICPLGELTQTDVSRIAAAANPYAMPKGSDDIRNDRLNGGDPPELFVEVEDE